MPHEPEPEWEIECGDPGNTLIKYCWSPTDVLEYCGCLLYGNNLIEVLFLRIREASSGAPGSLGDTYAPEPSKKPEWIMKSFDANGQTSCRLLESKHELFGMLIAHVRLGAGLIEVRHVTNAGEIGDD
jgi:hypothetical protein